MLATRTTRNGEVSHKATSSRASKQEAPATRWWNGFCSVVSLTVSLSSFCLPVICVCLLAYLPDCLFLPLLHTYLKRRAERAARLGIDRTHPEVVKSVWREPRDLTSVCATLVGRHRSPCSRSRSCRQSCRRPGWGDAATATTAAAAAAACRRCHRCHLHEIAGNAVVSKERKSVIGGAFSGWS